MKKLFFIIVFLNTFTAFSQKSSKIDSTYYLIDTAKIPANARMWEIHEEYTSFKEFVIQCPCLRYNQQPSFIYDEKAPTSGLISKKELDKLKLVNLTTLIAKAKKFTDMGYTGKYFIGFIEPRGKEYIFHEVRLLNPVKPRNPSIDYENIQPIDSNKKKKP
jgi:hypothetical protein